MGSLMALVAHSSLELGPKNPISNLESKNFSCHSEPFGYWKELSIARHCKVSSHRQQKEALLGSSCSFWASDCWTKELSDENVLRPTLTFPVPVDPWWRCFRRRRCWRGNPGIAGVSAVLLLAGEEPCSPWSEEGRGDLGRAEPQLGHCLGGVDARACFSYLWNGHVVHLIFCEGCVDLVLCVKNEYFYQVLHLIKIVMSEVNYQHYLQYLLHSILAASESYLLEMKKFSFPYNSSLLGFNQECFLTPWLDLCLKDIRVLWLGGWFAQYRKRRLAPVAVSLCSGCLRQGGTLKGLCQAHFHIFVD